MTDETRHVKIRSTRQGKVPVDVMIPGWARQHPEVIDHAIALAKQRAEKDPAIAALDLPAKSAVMVALIETWFAGASERRHAGPLNEDAEALAQAMANGAVERLSVPGVDTGPIAVFMRRVACIVEERAVADMGRRRERLDS